MMKKTERLPLPPERTAAKPWAKGPEPKRGQGQFPKSPESAVKPRAPLPRKEAQVPEEFEESDGGEDAEEDFRGAGFDLEEGLGGGDDKNDFERVFAQMLNPNNIRHVTELNSDEITAFSVLGSIGKRYKLEVLKAFLLENAEWRVSKNRKGRNEVVRINQRTSSPEAPQQRRFFDFRR